MLFGQNRKLSKVEIAFFVRNATHQVKQLGLFIDDKLSGESIVSLIVQKVNNRLKLYRQARFLDQKSKLSMCSALIQCHLDYSCSSRYSGLTNTLKRKLQICQNKCVIFIYDIPPRHSVNCDIFKSLNMLNIEHRVKQMRLNHVFNIVQDRVPLYMDNSFTLVSSSYLNTRSVRKCIYCRYNTNLNSFHFEHSFWSVNLKYSSISLVELYALVSGI